MKRRINSQFTRIALMFIFWVSLSKSHEAIAYNPVTTTPTMIPIKDLMLEVHFERSISKGQTHSDKQLCEQWLNAFFPGRGPWGFGISKTSSCKFDEAKEEFESKIYFSTVLLFIAQNKTKPSQTEFTLCMAKLNQNEVFTVNWNRRMLQCNNPLSVETQTVRDVLLRDPRFARLVAAQLLERFLFLSQSLRSAPGLQKSEQINQNGVRSNVELPAPPKQSREVQLYYDLSKSTFITRDIVQNASPATTAQNPINIWIVTTQKSQDRTLEYLKLQQDLLNELTAKTRRPSTAARMPVKDRLIQETPVPPEEIDDSSTKMEWASWMNYGLPANSLQREYRIGLSTGVHFAPGLSMSVGYEFKTSSYRLNPNPDSGSFTTKILEHSVFLSPVEASLGWTMLSRTLISSIEPRYILSSRDISLRDDGKPDAKAQVESRLHNAAGLRGTLAMQLYGNLYLDAQTGIAKNLVDGTTDLSGLVGMSWKQLTTDNGQSGLQGSVFVVQDSIQRKMKVNPETSTSLFDAILNSFALGFQLSFIPE